MICNYKLENRLRFAHDHWNRLVLLDESQQPLPVEPVRTFPLSDPTHGISLCDSEGHEVTCIDDLTTLDAEARQVIEAELARREFAPIIERIRSISDDLDESEWEVETDRGQTSFRLKTEDDVRRMGDHRALVTDNHGVRYSIPDVRQLDAPSRRMLGRYL